MVCCSNASINCPWCVLFMVAYEIAVCLIKSSSINKATILFACIHLADMPIFADHACAMDMYIPCIHSETYTPCFCSSYRVQRKVVSLCVFKDSDWLQLSTGHYRYDSITTLVMHRAVIGMSIHLPAGDHVVLTYFRYPVNSSQYYTHQSSHTVW